MTAIFLVPLLSWNVKIGSRKNWEKHASWGNRAADKPSKMEKQQVTAKDGNRGETRNTTGMRNYSRLEKDFGLNGETVCGERTYIEKLDGIRVDTIRKLVIIAIGGKIGNPLPSLHSNFTEQERTAKSPTTYRLCTASPVRAGPRWGPLTGPEEYHG